MQIQARNALLRKGVSRLFHTDSHHIAMRCSVKLRIRKDKKSKSGLGSVYLQVIINRKRTTVPLGISWPIDRFDEQAERFLPRDSKDIECQDWNMEAQKELAKVNDIFIFYRLSDHELSIEEFQKEYRRYGSRHNFIAFCYAEIEDRYTGGKISNQTYRNSKSAIKRVADWKASIKFADLHAGLLEDLEGYLKAQGLKVNAIWSILKTIKTYANRAAEKGIAVKLDSLHTFKIKTGQTRITYLSPSELQKLKKYYHAHNCPDNHSQVLRHFLFSCCTGLRFSDVSRVNWKNIEDEMLIFQPYKTRNIEKLVYVPLIDEAFTYIQNRKGLLFDCLAEQVTNRILKDIAIACGIRKNLTTHVARHTFATEFLRRGGHIEVLQKLLGHTKISTTMIYAHVSKDRLIEQMKVFEIP